MVATIPPVSPADTTPDVVSVDALVDATPQHRDRVVDLLRAISIAVVVLWHWTFSITHWAGGSLRMPNPIGDVPGLWLATWLLQVMPLFFLVGGYANLAAWEAVTRAGHGATVFWRKRFARLVRPVAVYLACWVVIDLAWQAGGGRSVLEWGMVVFVPLWFLGVYVAVVALVPMTARAHRAEPVLTLVLLGVGIAGADLGRFRFGLAGLGLAGSALVWVFCHQLGFFWRDWVAGRAGLRRRTGTLVGIGLAALVALTSLDVYPRSMVAVRGQATSNMFPTTACVAALAVLQLGVVLAVREPLNRWLQGRRTWRAVVAANGVAMTVFCWHMTALVAFVLAYEAAGYSLSDEATAAWWLTRPLWIVGPGLVLAGLLATFARFELPGRSGSRRSAVTSGRG
jgi:surface polysaccharide O-acyltransferase-like enzyme